MRELAVLMFQTLDGIVQAPGAVDEDRSGGFQHGGWAVPYWQGVMEQVERVAMVEPYDMLFGRRTFEAFAAHWSSVDPSDSVAQRMNSARKYVASTTLTQAGWTNSAILEGPVVDAVHRLKAMDGPLLQTHGSSALVQTLARADLVDEYRLWTFPIALGSGKRLFGGEELLSLTLSHSEPTGNGVVMNIYRRAV